MTSEKKDIHYMQLKKDTLPTSAIQRNKETKEWWGYNGTKTEQELSYLPTPPLRQDMTQGQFLSGV